MRRVKGDGSDLQRRGRSDVPNSRCFGSSPAALDPAQREDSNAMRQELDAKWPRLRKTEINVKSCREFNEGYKIITRGETIPDEVQVRGRIWGFRIAGKKLAFIDMMQDNSKLQVVCNYRNLEQAGVSHESFLQFIDGLKRGNIISATGRPHRTNREELSLRISELPVLLSSCVRPLPTEITNEESRVRFRHVDLLIRPQAAQLLKLGSDIRKFLRSFLEEQGHICVKTPVLGGAAGGAVARPIFTDPTQGRRMALRIAPELWLKRLIIGGFERIYEIGPCFRNEGQY